MSRGPDLRGLRLIDYGVIIAKLSTFLAGRQNIQVWRMKRGILKTVDWFTDQKPKRYKSADYNL